MAKQSMKFHITAHPINTTLQKKLGIYSTSDYEKGNCKSQSVGKVIAALVADGCDKIHSYHDVERNMMVMHCSAK